MLSGGGGCFSQIHDSARPHALARARVASFGACSGKSLVIPLTNLIWRQMVVTCSRGLRSVWVEGGLLAMVQRAGWSWLRSLAADDSTIGVEGLVSCCGVCLGDRGDRVEGGNRVL